MSIPAGTLDLVPDEEVEGNVYVCGAIKLGIIARSKDLQPGSFLNDEFRFDRWVETQGQALKNKDTKAKGCLLHSISDESSWKPEV